MSDQEKQPSLEARALAELLLYWHREVGTKLAGRKMSAQPESLAKYLQLVEEFADADFSESPTQIAIARQQISGSFEWFYGEEIPFHIMKKWAQGKDIDWQLPLHLHQVARRILAINERRHDVSPQKVSRGRILIGFSGREDLLQKSRDVYQEFGMEENIGIGGANFLLACSLERCPWSPDQGGDVKKVILIDDSILGVQRVAPNDRGDDLLDHLRSKKLSIIMSIGS